VLPGLGGGHQSTSSWIEYRRVEECAFTSKHHHSSRWRSLSSGLTFPKLSLEVRNFHYLAASKCVVCFVDAYLLWNFALDGEQKWKNVDELSRFCWDMSRELQQRFKVWLVDYLTEFGVQMIKLSFLLLLLCFSLEWWGMMCEMNV
jgi:hypothetical protein